MSNLSPRSRWRAALSAVVIATLPLATAHAVVTPRHLAQRAPFEVVGQKRAYVAPNVTWEAPTSARPAWQRFVDAHGAGWHGLFDAETGVARRVWGQGIPAPGASRDAAKAARAARQALAAHLDLFAPGASIDDFVLVTNHVDAQSGLRSVGFVQERAGVPVLGGRISVRIKRDRVFVLASDAVTAEGTPRATRITADAARAAARADIAQAFGGQPKVTTVSEPMLLPFLGASGPTVRTVVAVRVDLVSPRGRWDVYVAVDDGRVIARRQRLHFASGTVTARVPIRHPGGDHRDLPVGLAALNVNGVTTQSDAAGGLTWVGDAAASVVAELGGAQVSVLTEAGAAFSETFELAPGGTHLFDKGAEEFLDAQLTAYTSVNVVKDAAKVFAPDLSFVDQHILATVNIDDTCNAFSDLTDIYFFRANDECQNTGRLTDVVYHEFGHSFHGNAIIGGVGGFDDSMSEGVGDYMAATVTGDPQMGRGFFFASPGNPSNAPLRDIEPDKVWPDDIDAEGDPHGTGLIYAGAIWDLRTALIADLGEEAGDLLADQLFYATTQRASDIPSAFPEALAADDDDGDLSNGTPNYCAIVGAFGRHGLAPDVYGYRVDPPTIDGNAVHVPTPVPQSECPVAPITGAKIFWFLRDDLTEYGDIPMTVNGDGSFDGTLPTVEDGHVLRYRITVELEDGTELSYPRNAADTEYERYVGPVTELYCTDLEGSAPPAGWSEDGSQWEWGTAVGGDGDPAAAFSGTRIWGTVIGHRYGRNRNATLTMPAIDTQGYPTVRLQYRRWLEVEQSQFDSAWIGSTAQILWTNHETKRHTDGEWRFHDVDITPLVVGGKVQPVFGLLTDQGAQFAGWSIDDVCVVGVGTPSGTPDAGPGAPDAGPAAGDGDDGGCGCRVGGSTGTTAPTGALVALGLVGGALLLRRRRRR